MALGEAKADQLVGNAERTAEQTKTSYESYVSDTATTAQSLKEQKKNLKSVKNTRDEQSAERQAAETTKSEILSITDALALIDAEDEANDAYRQAQSQYMSAAFTTLGNNISSGAKVFMQNADSLGEGIVNGIDVKPLLIGAATGVVSSFLPDAGSDFVTSFVSGWEASAMGLKDIELEDGVEDKGQIVTSEEMKSDVSKGTSGINTGVGSDATEDKDVSGDDYKPTDTSQDATSVSSDELDKMSKLADIGDIVKEKTSAMSEVLESSGHNVLAAAVSTAGVLFDKYADKKTDTSVEKLTKKAGEIDKNDDSKDDKDTSYGK